MAKKEDKKKAEDSAAGKKESDTLAEDNQGPDDNQGPKTATEIETVEDLELCYPALVSEIKTGIAPLCQTVEDLEACYPRLVSEIRDEVFKTIGTSTAKEAKANLPELYQRIVTDIQSKSGPALNVPGFLLEIDDPFAESTLRTYQNLKRVSGFRLPFVLPFKDKVTRATLENYALRASGGGDSKRADAAIAAMEKIKIK